VTLSLRPLRFASFTTLADRGEHAALAGIGVSGQMSRVTLPCSHGSARRREPLAAATDLLGPLRELHRAVAVVVSVAHLIAQ
jgi:hypothetical protein